MNTAIKVASQLHTPAVLLVEDSQSDALLIERALRSSMPGGCTIRRVASLEAARQALSEGEYDVALLDLSLPDGAEFEGLSTLQSLAPKLPIIILTAYQDEEISFKAVERGAQDYLFKHSIDGDSIRRAMQYAVQRKQFEASLITQANFDPLTGLANRTLFESRLDMALARMRRIGIGLGLFFLDLNRFKQVNDTLGHAAGDVVLQKVGDLLSQSLRPYDTAARFGGDEFALLVEGIAQPRDCASIAHKIITQLDKPLYLESFGRDADIGASIGIATCFPGDEITREKLMRHADEAMYGAKLAGQSNYRFYTPLLHEQASSRLKLEEELRAALTQGELSLHYQPKLDLVTKKTTGLEALVRWEHPTRGLLLPAEFMAVVEETGLAHKLCIWVITAVCADMDRWRILGLPRVPISVNLSGADLENPVYLELLRNLLRAYSIPPHMLAVEIPSEAFLQAGETMIAALSELRTMGIEVHVDRFGLAAVPLAALASLPVDAVKIAPELTGRINEPVGALPLLQAIMDIATRLNLKVIASGIENEWQSSFYKGHACREGQGFLLCRPIPESFVPAWLGQVPKS